MLVAAQNRIQQNILIHESMCVGRMDGIIFPDPDNCDAYVQCRGGAVIRQRCQSGTLFDLTLYFCVPSHSINCGMRRQPISGNTPNSPGTPPSHEAHHSVSIYCAFLS